MKVPWPAAGAARGARPAGSRQRVAARRAARRTTPAAGGLFAAAAAAVVLAAAAPPAAAGPGTPASSVVLLFPPDAPDTATGSALEDGARTALAAAGFVPLAPVAALEHHLVEIGCDAPTPPCLARVAAALGAAGAITLTAADGRLAAVVANGDGRAESADRDLAVGTPAPEAQARALALVRALLRRAGLRAAPAPDAPRGAAPEPHLRARLRLPSVAVWLGAAIVAGGAVYAAARGATLAAALDDPGLPPARASLLRARRARLTAAAIDLAAGAASLGAVGVVLLFAF
ncbi:MAG TPA: hypothetical protein VG389_16760 [Myxococcota bacterium]|jgi:hypothetical protein|nr:hypothetical protein [Myxococcota bacterium]